MATPMNLLKEQVEDSCSLYKHVGDCSMCPMLSVDGKMCILRMAIQQHDKEIMTLTERMQHYAGFSVSGPEVAELYSKWLGERHQRE